MSSINEDMKMEDVQKSKMRKREKIAYGTGAATLGAAAYSGVMGSMWKDKRNIAAQQAMSRAGMSTHEINKLMAPKVDNWTIYRTLRKPLAIAGAATAATGAVLSHRRKKKERTQG